MKILLIELWGLGDATIATTALQPLLDSGASVTILCKPATVELLSPTYPTVSFLPFDAPWIAFRGKYQLWNWPWRKLFSIMWTCRRSKFGIAASVRNDPRDHLLMFLSGAQERIGFPRRGSKILLTRALPSPSNKAHRVDLWRLISKAVIESWSPHVVEDSLNVAQRISVSAPFLDARAYLAPQPGIVAEEGRPIIGLHCGARIPVRRWNEESFRRIIELLRTEVDFHLALFPDLDGYGRTLLLLADSCHEALSIPELVADLAACDLIICNDSGPGHIAAAMGRPVLSIFGPTLPEWFRPYGEKNHIVIRDICPFRPCFDYCHFPEPICLTHLSPDDAWPEIRDWVHYHLKRNRTSNVI